MYAYLEAQSNSINMLTSILWGKKYGDLQNDLKEKRDTYNYLAEEIEKMEDNYQFVSDDLYNVLSDADDAYQLAYDKVYGVE